MQVRIDSYGNGVGHKIYRNYFHGAKGRNANALEIGTNGNHRTVQTDVVAEYNLIADWTGGRCLSTKVGGTTLRFNTCLNAGSEDAVNRLGTRNKWIANWIEGSTGDALRIIDQGNEVIGNRIIGSAHLRLHTGNCTPPESGLSGCASPAYPAATDTLLAGNDGEVRVGDGYNCCNVPARNTRIEAHEGEIKYGNHGNTDVSDSTSRTIPDAVKLSPPDVGPFAPTAPRLAPIA